MTGTLNASPIHHKPIYKCRTLKFSSISLSHKKAKELKEKNTLKEIEKFTKNKKSFIVYSPSCHYNSTFRMFMLLFSTQ